ncbi:MAG TPA: TetR/AcrR family transcriptional regulator, partial [Thermomicrobiales bacterium]|nr:TetR/AcrR family transcriptional regulator [Thermomicrobiales bacterium]
RLSAERRSWYPAGEMSGRDEAATTPTGPAAREAIPEPPWRADARAAPRQPLTREVIVEAALRVLDREGLDNLSMRRVAEELGTGAASLYWHVRNKGELLQLLFERLSGEIELPEPDPARWREQLRDLARQMRASAHRHRDAARISLGRVPAGPAMARFAEWTFALLTPLGIPDRVIAYLGDLASLYVGAYAFEETLGLASPTGEDLPPEQIVAMFRDYLVSLPAERFPHVHRAVGDLLGGDADERFEFGLDVILRGIASYARPGAARDGDEPGHGC